MRDLIKKYFKLLIISLFVISVLIFWAASGANPTNIQPIAYNHKLHIESVELICSDCHIYVESMPSATIPNISICEECHSDDPITDSPEELKLIKYIVEEEQIPWQQIYSVPDHVYFSHRRHVSIGELDCSECHGHVEEMTEPISYPAWLPSMDNCIACHNELKITKDCLSCHM
ncbi:MAG: cytochrome c family protein [Bacteroidetes bacterium]|nr:cytochrome c family protein [Bacteroidota bacterium]MBU1681041.1 cytochrome c family protein [Bacteroidota bacterium]MBU2506590.1 cytochrome c family protein [Bacteroidota bacterium]